MNQYWIERWADLSYYIREVKEDLDRYMLNAVTRRILCDFLDDAYEEYKAAGRIMKQKEEFYVTKQSED